MHPDKGSTCMPTSGQVLTTCMPVYRQDRNSTARIQPCMHAQRGFGPAGCRAGQRPTPHIALPEPTHPPCPGHACRPGRAVAVAHRNASRVDVEENRVGRLLNQHNQLRRDELCHARIDRHALRIGCGGRVDVGAAHKASALRQCGGSGTMSGNSVAGSPPQPDPPSVAGVPRQGAARTASLACAALREGRRRRAETAAAIRPRLPSHSH
eukprot:366577-Chlamydomonas_euryale.AAC.16